MTSTPDGAKNGVKTLAIRLEPELHAQLSLIAQLRASTITDEIRQAIDGHILTVKQLPEFADRAENALAEIERDAAARRNAVTTLFGPPSDEPAPAKPQGGPARKQRGGNSGGS